jgi:RNA-binding protein YhbY
MQVNIGKRGLSEGTFELLGNAFKKNRDIKIAVLKSASHEREKVKQMAEEIINKLGKNFTYRIVGFTIFVKRWRKEKR